MQVGLCLYKISEIMKNVLVAMEKIVLLRNFFLNICTLYLVKVFVKQLQIKTSIYMNVIPQLVPV